MTMYVEALCQEIAARRQELPNTRVRTIYIGGGTPSLLPTPLLRRILDCVWQHYEVEAEAEVTMEMNPDDSVDIAQLREVNRVSLGIQTFNDDLLRLIRRRHDSATAIRAVHALQEAGISNISIDLIYGLPGQTMALWEHDLDTAFSLGVQHLSAYALSYEQGTALTRWRNEGRIQEVPEELSVAMYERLCQRARKAGFEHYEISNFALPSFHSRHNSSYWTGAPYLGFGPGAHSYDGDHTRRANLPSLDLYMNGGKQEVEVLTEDECYDEMVMCGLRTSDGVDLDRMAKRFGAERAQTLLRQAAPHIAAGRLAHRGNKLCLTTKSLMISDDIMSDLMAIES